MLVVDHLNPFANRDVPLVLLGFSSSSDTSIFRMGFDDLKIRYDENPASVQLSAC